MLFWRCLALTLCSILYVTCALGCAASSRTTAKGATQGVMDAMRQPDDELVVMGRELAKKYMRSALEAPSPKGLDDIMRDVTTAVLEELRAQAPEQREIVRALVQEAVGTAIQSARDEVATTGPTIHVLAAQMSSGIVAGIARNSDDISELVQKTSSEAGRAIAKEMAGELAGQLRSHLGPTSERQPLSSAVAALAAHATQGAIAGASLELEALTKEGCAEGKNPSECPPGLVRRLSRAVALGAAEGVGFKIAWWHLAVAFASGIGLTFAGAWGLRKIQTKRLNVRQT